jgi:hypothetical protein
MFHSDCRVASVKANRSGYEPMGRFAACVSNCSILCLVIPDLFLSDKVRRQVTFDAAGRNQHYLQLCRPAA